MSIGSYMVTEKNKPAEHQGGPRPPPFIDFLFELCYFT